MSEETGGIVSVVHDGFSISTNEGTAKDIKANLESEPKPLDGDDEDIAEAKEKEAKEKRSEAAAELGKAGGKAAAEARDKADSKAKEDEKAKPAEGDEKQPSPRHDARARIQQLARERAEERQRRQELEQRLARLEDTRKEPQSSDGKPAKDEMPTPETFETYEQYVERVAESIADRKMDERIAKIVQEAEQHREVQARVSETQTRIEGFIEKISKDPEIIGRVDERLLSFEPSFTLPPGTPLGPTNVMADEIMSSDIAPQLMLYFTEREDEVRRILSLPDARSISKAVGQVEYQLANKEHTAGVHTTQAGSVQSISFAKPPVRPLSSTAPAGTDEEPDENTDFDTYVRVMNARDQRRRRGR